MYLYNLGFLHQDCDAHEVVIGNRKVNNTFSLSHYTDGTKTNVSPPVDQLADHAVPIALFILLTIQTVRSHVQLVFEAEIALFVLIRIL